ncbi:hypothetical protein M514_08382 [Trichuris suis]|uniref:Uncharacterized protein n=1 Tax=Trichuris suis TaxID=68888 RepID=A0A085M0I0_9BILA|nr:hypothetical protein M513_08382 [Trichuris suis]KFD63169.1 hypothetical protein M514_08382 [Trichuris suis]
MSLSGTRLQLRTVVHFAYWRSHEKTTVDFCQWELYLREGDLATSLLAQTLLQKCTRTTLLNGTPACEKIQLPRWSAANSLQDLAALWGWTKAFSARGSTVAGSLIQGHVPWDHDHNGPVARIYRFLQAWLQALAYQPAGQFHRTADEGAYAAD